jgi:hypothetical protein
VEFKQKNVDKKITKKGQKAGSEIILKQLKNRLIFCEKQCMQLQLRTNLLMVPVPKICPLVLA